VVRHCGGAPEERHAPDQLYAAKAADIQVPGAAGMAGRLSFLPATRRVRVPPPL